MSGPSDAQTPAGPGRSPRRPAPPSGLRGFLRWILVPGILGALTGTLVILVPWTRYVLVLTFVGSGLAVILRVAGDRLVEWAGPTRGVAVLGAILFGSWILMAISPPRALRGLGVGSIRPAPEPKDPYALPPAGSTHALPGLQEPAQPLDALQPLRDLVTAAPVYEPKPLPEPPADGRRATPRVTLRLSSSRSSFGEGVVLIAEVAGDSRAVHGLVAFVVDGKVVEQRTLRVQGVTSQIEYRLAGLAVGTHTFEANYLGSRTFFAATSAPVQHQVTARQSQER
jgi:hypothetical protein